MAPARRGVGAEGRGWETGRGDIGALCPALCPAGRGALPCGVSALLPSLAPGVSGERLTRGCAYEGEVARGFPCAPCAVGALCICMIGCPQAPQRRFSGLLVTPHFWHRMFTPTSSLASARGALRAPRR